MNGILIHLDEMEEDGSYGLEDKVQEVHLVLEDDLGIVRVNEDVQTVDDLYL